MLLFLLDNEDVKCGITNGFEVTLALTIDKRASGVKDWKSAVPHDFQSRALPI